jgi:hypothetical protein
MLPNGILEYIFTIGIIISAIALVVGAVKERKNIRETLGKYGFERKDFLIIIAIVLVFAFIELYFIKPTQLLFFDDAIYQGMALDLIHMGQAWMCNYGTPTMCFSGQVYHEPIGLSANMALGFLLFGAKRSVAYGVEFMLGVLSVFVCFFASLLLLKSKRAAYFAALLLALSPVLLVWAMPTNSDLAVLAYSLVAVFFMMLFIERKTIWSFSNLLFSFSLLMYMKVDEVFFIPIFLLFYILLDDKSVRKAIGNGFRTIRKNFLNTKLLIILLFFVFAIAPSVLYSYNESRTDSYGYTGTTIQNTCTRNLAPVSVTGSINLQNFNANICANVVFWFNQYKSTYIMQPILFTALAIVGLAIMLMHKRHRREAIAVGIWFLVFFLLYAAFYAGSVIYGVDWRFQLSMIAQACILGGFCLGFILGEGENWLKKRFKNNYQSLSLVVLAVMLVIVFYPIYAMMPLLAVNPSAVVQAGDARFYEGFVYNNSALIPPGCIVYTYDPTLFNMNNRTATQIDNLYNTTQVNQYRSTYQCLVLDYGYWCHTPNNECAYVNKTYNLTPIVTATYKQFNYNYGFYTVK